MIVAVITVRTIDIINANAAAFSDTNILVNYCALNDCASPYSDIWNSRFRVLSFLRFIFIVVGTHTNNAVKA